MPERNEFEFDQITRSIELIAQAARARRERRLVDALASYEQAVALLRRGDDVLRLAHTVRHLADVHQDAGRLDLAEPCYNEALAIYRGNASTPPLDLANAIRGLALLKERAGEVGDAVRLWTEAGVLYRSVNVQVGIDESFAHVARLKE